jgi:hypothetical protein
MKNRNKCIHKTLPSFERTYEIFMNKSCVLPDSRKLKKRARVIYETAEQTIRKGIVKPHEVVAKTSERMGVRPEEAPETYTLILIIVGIMTATLLTRLARERERLSVYINQLMDQKTRRNNSSLSFEEGVRSRRMHRLMRYHRRFTDNQIPHSLLQDTPVDDTPRPENPLFPMLEEVQNSLTAGDFRYLVDSPAPGRQIERVYYYLKDVFCESGTVADFDMTRTEQHLVLSLDPIGYAVGWYAWNTTVMLQNTIATGMKPVVEAGANTS